MLPTMGTGRDSDRSRSGASPVEWRWDVHGKLFAALTLAFGLAGVGIAVAGMTDLANSPRRGLFWQAAAGAAMFAVFGCFFAYVSVRTVRSGRADDGTLVVRRLLGPARVIARSEILGIGTNAAHGIYAMVRPGCRLVSLGFDREILPGLQLSEALRELYGAAGRCAAWDELCTRPTKELLAGASFRRSETVMRARAVAEAAFLVASIALVPRAWDFLFEPTIREAVVTFRYWLALVYAAAFVCVLADVLSWWRTGILVGVDARKEAIEVHWLWRQWICPGTCIAGVTVSEATAGHAWSVYVHVEHDGGESVYRVPLPSGTRASKRVALGLACLYGERLQDYDESLQA